MVNVQVGGLEKDWHDVDQHWLCNLIRGLREAGQSDCVRVRIQDGEVDLSLTTPGCDTGRVGGRALRGREPKIVELWRKLHLDQAGFSCGNVNAFMAQLRRLL